MNDADLVEAARAGDRQAFGAIYDRYADGIHDFCTSMLRDRHEAADATQDVFLRAAERLHQLREPAKLRSWLFAVARFEALGRIRARGRVQPTEEMADMAAPETAAMGGADRTAQQGDLRDLVWDAAAGLDDRDRAVLDLHLRQGLDGRELGDAIGVGASHANVLLHRMRERFERSLGALLVARTGRRDCPDLQAVLTGWDGSFSPLIRKRVARHVDRCEACGERKRTMASPAALLAAVPVVRAPAELRDRVLGDVELVSNVRHLGGWRRDGFPPPMDDDARRFRFGAFVAAAILALLLGSLALVTGGDDARDLEVAAGGGGVATDTTTATAAPGTTVTTVTTRSSRATTTRPPAGIPPATPGSPGATVTTSPSSSTSTSTTTSTVPDTTPPVVGAISASPGSIWETDCANPHTSTVSVSVSDESAVTVTMAWSVNDHSGSKSMSGAGTYTATVGPFAKGTVPPYTYQQVTLTVTARDAYDNVGTSTSSALTLHSCDVVT